ncbi:transcriptional regulator, partial [Aeromonas caviae]
RLICPFEQVLVSKNAFYLVCQEQQSDQGKIVAFRDWMLELVEQEEARRRARLADA